MIRILTIEPGKGGVLTQVLSAFHMDFETVLVNSHGRAMEELKSKPFEAAFVDVQLAEAWRLLEWLQKEQPRLGRFVLLPEDTPELRQRAARLGVIACMVEPFDATDMLVQLTSGLAETCYGSLHNMNIPAFLQLLEIERKTCSLRIESAGRTGTMFVMRGELLEARFDGLTADTAAYVIIGWLTGDVYVEHGCFAPERTIHRPISHVLMSALQYRDEAGRNVPVEFDGEEMSFKRLQESLVPLKSELPPVPRLPSFLARLPKTMTLFPGSLGLALVDAETGLTLACESKPPIDMSQWAESAASVLRQEYVTLAASQADAELMELVVSTQSCCELIKPLPKRPRCFALLLFDPDETNLVMARIEIDRWVNEYA
ncbi:MAG: DUF4388 domain-containing protein [Myxococcales bacterium]